ncbi:MAG: hypothetical protein J6R18_01785 [Kiritimatiellae bacterium]|nr:hypothetical protein [Kiritimatiellia bacterium]
MMDNVYSQMLITAKNAGINVVGKHKAAKLLALCCAIGDEPFVFNKKLYEDVMYAADVTGIKHMNYPLEEITSLINKYYNDLQIGTADWVQEINEEYKTKFPKKMESDGREKLIWPSMLI